MLLKFSNKISLVNENLLNCARNQQVSFEENILSIYSFIKKIMQETRCVGEHEQNQILIELVNRKYAHKNLGCHSYE